MIPGALLQRKLVIITASNREFIFGPTWPMRKTDDGQQLPRKIAEP